MGYQGIYSKNTKESRREEMDRRVCVCVISHTHTHNKHILQTSVPCTAGKMASRLQDIPSVPIDPSAVECGTEIACIVAVDGFSPDISPRLEEL